jgi:hypothetical protein
VTTPVRTGRGVRGGDFEAFERALEGLCRAVDDAVGGQDDWLCRVRTGLVAFLGFLDDERGVALLLFGGPARLDAVAQVRCERRVLGVLTGLLASGREGLADSADCELVASWALIDELAAGGAYAVIRTRLCGGGPGSLVELAPDLLAFMTLPYLGQGQVAGRFMGQAPVPSLDPLRVALPIRVTHRTTLVLRAIANRPCARNLDIAQEAGPIDEGQLSKLLARLAARGLIENLSRGGAQRTKPSAWRLTSEGERALRLIDAGPLRPPRRGGSSA